MKAELVDRKKDTLRAKRQTAAAKKRARTLSDQLAAATEAQEQGTAETAAKEQQQPDRLPATPGQQLEACLEQLLEEDYPALGEEHQSEAEPPLPPPESPPPAGEAAEDPAVPAFSEGDRVRICSWEARRLILGKEGVSRAWLAPTPWSSWR